MRGAPDGRCEVIRQRRPLSRKTPLRRASKLRPRSKTKAYRKRPRDLEYLRWLKTQPCVARFGVDRCWGEIEAAHREVGGRAMGQKTPDVEALPLCSRHHRLPGLHVCSEWLVLTKPQRAEFWMSAVEKVRARYLAQQPTEGGR